MFRSIRVQLLAIQFFSLLLLLLVGLAAIGQVQRLSMDSARQYALASARQAKSGIESILENVCVSTRSFCYSTPVQQILATDETDLLKLADMYRSFSNNVSYAINTNSNIVDICLVPEEGAPYVFGSQASKVLGRALELYDQAGGQGALFTGFFSEEPGLGTEYYAYILPVNCAQPGADFSRQVGLCLVLCRTSSVLELLESADLDNSSLTLVYNGGRDQLRARSASLPLEGAELNRYPFDQVDWELLQAVDPAAAFTGDLSTQALISSFLLIAALGTGIFVFFSYRNISRPVTQMKAQLLQNAQTPESPSLIAISANNELESIAVEINRMLVKIRDSTKRSIENQDRLYKAELLQRRLQFSALQSQINPHFLYNTLSCIRGIALENDQDEIASVTVKMAKIFRYAIKGDSFVQVRDELAIIRRYVEIMNLRMNDKFHTSVEAPEEVLGCWTPRMVLQPIVENAIFHGLEGLAREGELSVRGSLVQDDRCLIEICDNGAGIPPDKLQSLRRLLRSAGGSSAQEVQENGMGIGLININRKIQLLLGPSYGLEVDSAPGQGTTVRVTLPLLRQKPRA